MDWWPQTGKDCDCLQNRGKMKWINQQNEKRPWNDQWELRTLNQGLRPCNQGHNWLSHLKLRSKKWGNTTPIQYVLWIYTEAAGLILMCVCAQSCLTLCHPMDYGPPRSTVHGTFPARILEWVAIFFSRGPSWPGDQTCISWIAVIFFSAEPPGFPYIHYCCYCCSLTKLCLTLCDPMDCSVPGFVVLRYLLDLPYPRVEPRSPELQADSLPSEPPGKLLYIHYVCAC